MTDSFHADRLLFDNPEKRDLCHAWLLDIMKGSSSGKTRTKSALRVEAIQRFEISKSAFERAWTWAAEEASKASLCATSWPMI